MWSGTANIEVDLSILALPKAQKDDDYDDDHHDLCFKYNENPTKIKQIHIKITKIYKKH